MKSLSKLTKYFGVILSATILTTAMPAVAGINDVSKSYTKRLPAPTPEFCQWCADHPIEASEGGFGCYVCDIFDLG